MTRLMGWGEVQIRDDEEGAVGDEWMMRRGRLRDGWEWWNEGKVEGG